MDDNMDDNIALWTITWTITYCKIYVLEIPPQKMSKNTTSNNV